MSVAFKNLGINKDHLFEQVKEAIDNITNTLEHIENTINSIVPDNKVDDFDLLSLREGLELNKEKFKAVKQEFRRAGGYEELLYSAVKSVNCLIKGVAVSAALHNAIVHFCLPEEEKAVTELQGRAVTELQGRAATELQEEILSQGEEVLLQEAEPQEEVKRRGRGRPARKTRKVPRPKAAQTTRVALDVEPVLFPQKELKVNTLLRHADREMERCVDCGISFEETEEKGILECPVCGTQAFQESEGDRQEHTVIQATETKHKRGGDQRFIELTQSIQGKLTIRDKDRTLVDEAIVEARKAFPHGAEDYNDINAWLRGTKVKSSAAPKGVKKYDTIYKYAPHIYSKVTGFELSSFTDREFAMIEKVYSYISSNFRELHCKLVSNQSTKSIKAEFFVDHLIDLYVTDVRRQRALKAVIARKTSESNAGNELIWKYVKEEYIKG